MRRAALGLSFAVIGAAACGGGTPPQVAQPATPDASVQTATIGDGGTRDAAPKPRPSKVVVAIVVDQLSAWAALERIPELPKDGGFARLVAEGTWVEELHYLHATTDTAPGHAALFTGATPRDTGIFGNEVIEEATGKRVSILRDAGATISGGAPGSGSSLARLRVETVADRLRAADPEARIISLSLKDRGALFGAGRNPDLAVWYDSKRGNFVTPAQPPRPAVDADSPDPAHDPAYQLHYVGASVPLEEDAPWTPLDAAWVAKHARVPDDQKGEGDLLGLGTTFPHPAPKATKWAPITARATPAGDRALVKLAIHALNTARTGHPFLLAISFSSHDYVGHVFGPDSWEALDELYRLDAQLATLFTALDVQFGADGWSAILSGDHGATPLPETPLAAREWCKPGAKDRFERPCAPGDRLFMDATAKELEAAATAALGPGPWIAGVADPWVYPTRKAIALPTDKRARLDRTVEQVLVTKHPRAVQRVLRFSTLADTCPPGESEAALLCNSAPSGQEDAWYVVTRPGSFFDPDYTEGHGSSHGSAHLFDRAVPLLVRGGGVTAGRVVKEPLEFRAYARTLSSLLGIEAPVAARWGVDLTAKR